MTSQTVLIGLDGATFTVLDALCEEGVMPFLAQFRAEGVSSVLRSVIPALTPPAWTSMVTGRSPGQHGVFDFFRKEEPQSHSMRFVTSREISVDDSIWSLANQYGMRAIVLNFPMTYPAPAIDGYVVPGWMPWKQLRLGCRPRDLYDRLKTLPAFDPHELAMDMAHEEKALEGCPPEEYADWIAMHTRREQRWFQIVEMLLAEEEPCELVTVLFDGVDKIQHLCWRFLDPQLVHTLQTPWEQAIRVACLDYFRQLDGLVARIVQLVSPDATVIMASDHGFGPQCRTFFVNRWLAERGDLVWADSVGGPQPVDEKILGVGQIARHSYLLDWTRTRAYAPMPSGNGIHIIQADEEHPHGVPAAEYAAYCDQLIADLLAITDPLTGLPVVSQVWKREEIFAGPNLALAPDLTLVLQDSGLISILDAPTAVAARPQPSGTHRPEGIFLARGPGIQPGVQAEELSILDVGPLVLASLGIPIPSEWEGALPTAALETGYVQARSAPKKSSAAPTPRPFEQSPEPLELDAEAQARLMQRLRALGYVN